MDSGNASWPLAKKQETLRLGDSFKICDLEDKDIVCLIPVFRQWFLREGEVIEAEVNHMADTLRRDISVANENIYLVARDLQDRAVGVVGCGKVNPRLASYQSESPISASGLIVAFISSEHRGYGLGKALMMAIFDRAREKGWAEMIWSSHPRYRDTAWLFYTGIAGKPVGMVDGLFEPGMTSPVWKKRFLQG